MPAIMPTRHDPRVRMERDGRRFDADAGSAMTTVIADDAPSGDRSIEGERNETSEDQDDRSRRSNRDPNDPDASLERNANAHGR
jgi:hypothetical protein